MAKNSCATPKNLIELMELTNRELDSLVQSKSNEFNVITQAIDDTNHRLERLYDAIETGKLDLGGPCPENKGITASPRAVTCPEE